MKKRILSMLLALVMVLSMVPVQALAEEAPVTEEPVAEIVAEEPADEEPAAEEPAAEEPAAEEPADEEPAAEEPAAEEPAAEEPAAEEPAAEEPAAEEPAVVAAETVAISQADELKELAVGAELPLTAAVLPEETTDKTVVWTSSDETVATVDETGVVTGVAAGTVTITAACGEVTGTYELTVVEADSVEVTVEAGVESPEGAPAVNTDIVTNLDTMVDRRVTAGQSLALAAWNPEKPDAVYGWEFPNPNHSLYARIFNGKLTPDSNRVLAPITVSVRAYNLADKDEVTDLYDIELVPAVKSILLKDETDEYYVTGEVFVNINAKADEPGGSCTIIPEILPVDACQDVEWDFKGSSSLYINISDPANLNILKVTHKGRTGSVVVVATAKDGSGVTAELTINFVKRATKIEIENAFTSNEKDLFDNNFMLAGATKTFVTNVQKDTTLADREVEWWVTDEFGDPDDFGDKDKGLDASVATITSGGKLTVSKGISEVKEIQIFARLKSDPTIISTAVKVMLYPMTTAVEIEPLASNNVEVTLEQIDLKVDTKPAAAMKRVRWSSSNESIAYFEKGEETKLDPTLMLKAPGKVRITCEAMDGSKKRDYLYLNVTAPVNYLTIEAPADSMASGSSMTLKATTWTIVDLYNLASSSNVKAANQKVTWSIVGADGLKTDAAVVNSSGRVTAKKVRYNTKVYITATSVEDKTISERIELTIKPSQPQTFLVGFDDVILGKDCVIEGTVLVNAGEYEYFIGMWYDRDIGDDGEFEKTMDATFTSSKTNVATITEDGALLAKNSGTTTITARATDSYGKLHTVKFNVKVLKKVGWVTISNPTNFNVRYGKSLTLKATAWTNDTMKTKATNQKFTWEAYENGERVDIGEKKIVSISSSGKITPKNVTENHTIEVYARSTEKQNGLEPGVLSNCIELTIRPKLAYQMKILCNDEYKSNAVVDVDDGADFKVEAYVSNPDSHLDGTEDDLTGEVVWATSNKKVIAIDEVTGAPEIVGLGKATLKATYSAIVDGGKKPTKFTTKINVTVINYIDGIDIVEPAQKLFVGKSVNLLYTITNPADEPATDRRVRWELADSAMEEYVTLNASSGKLYAKKYTDDTIEVTAWAMDGSGESASIDITMHQPVASIAIYDGAENVTGKVVAVELSDETADFDAVVLDKGGDPCEFVKWTSSRTSVAKIDEKTGDITLMGRGTTVIKVTSTDGYNKSVKFTLKVE